MRKKSPASRRPKLRKPEPASAAVVIVQSVNVPGYTARVNRAKYTAMRRALLRVLPRRAPGLTQREMFESVIEHLPEDLFPGGAKANWWAKTVQLDLEAKRIVKRSTRVKPLRWYRVKLTGRARMVRETNHPKHEGQT